MPLMTIGLVAARIVGSLGFALELASLPLLDTVSRSLHTCPTICVAIAAL